jgi:hypothetical protein
MTRQPTGRPPYGIRVLLVLPDDALAECDDRGLDALPLAPLELARRFLLLWQTAKAAEHWIAKNPRKAIRDIIRVWGVLNSYRPRGQPELVQGTGAARDGCAGGDRGRSGHDKH